MAQVCSSGPLLVGGVIQQENLKVNLAENSLQGSETLKRKVGTGRSQMQITAGSLLAICDPLDPKGGSHGSHKQKRHVIPYDE